MSYVKDFKQAILEQPLNFWLFGVPGGDGYLSPRPGVSFGWLSHALDQRLKKCKKERIQPECFLT